MKAINSNETSSEKECLVKDSVLYLEDSLRQLRLEDLWDIKRPFLNSCSRTISFSGCVLFLM